MWETKLAFCAAIGMLASGAHAETHKFVPDHHSRVFSAHETPVLRIRTGDTVITKTWDSGGQDDKGVRHIRQPYVYPESGNPLTGPFYIEDADYGDALEVHLDQVRLNRNWGYTSYRLSPDILTSGAAEGQYKNFYKMDVLRPQRADLIPWDIDLEHQTVSPRLLESSGFRFGLRAVPMLGCIGVATAGYEVLTSGPAGPHGGNMDYNDVVEGATLFFPVFHKGAYFYVGDGHALQGDGEGLGSGVETSLDVQFTVRLHKGKRLSIPRLINDEYLVSIGSQPEFSSSMDFGIRMANADMLRWLTSDYKLSAPEANMLMGTVVRHKIVTYFGSMATLIPRKYVDKGMSMVAQTTPSGAGAKAALYAATGPELTTYSLNVETASLVKQGSVTLPQNVQEAWVHPSRRYLYVTWSNNVAGGQHGVTAFRIDPANGALQQHGQPISLAARSVFMSLDIPGKFLVVAYNDPSHATVHRIAADGTLGAAVPQSSTLDFGVYAHQVRVDPSNQMVIVITRGNGPTSTKAEDPGALKVFGYKDGLLTNRASIAPGGGYNFQPRHLEFHPTRPFVFITLERQNKLQVYRKLDGPTLSAAPLFTKETLVDPSRLAGQSTSAIHIHPKGQFLYLGNRAGATGENSIAVYSIDQNTGEPTLIQNADTHGVHPRTFAIDPSGRILVVANMQEVRGVPATLSMFRIVSDGKLEFVRKYDQDTSGGKSLFWTGIVQLP